MASLKTIPPTSLPISILAGGLFIGAGLFLGLRGPAPLMAITPGYTAQTLTSPPAHSAPAPATTGKWPNQALKHAVTRQAASALEIQRGTFVKVCWDPSFRASTEPPQVRYVVKMSFNKDGKEIARGVSDVRGMERKDVGRCLRAQPMNVQIPPPGVNMSVEVQLTLP